MIIAIDVDNTLLVRERDKTVLRSDMVVLMMTVKGLGLAEIVVWSGGGQDYAEQMVNRYGISHLVDRCAGKGDSTLHPDITIDDQVQTAGRVNLRLPGDIEPTPWMGVW
jgi:hypothetical protein